MATTKESGLSLAMLISGNGTTAEAVIKSSQNGELTGIIPAVVIASLPDVDGLVRAEALGVETLVVQRKDFETAKAFGEKLLNIFNNLGVKLISQNGWIVKTPSNVINNYLGMIINQHPGSLDASKPDFGGQGMYGSRVTAAVLAYYWLINQREPFTEATVHHVTQNYDEGSIIRVTPMKAANLGRQISIDELRKDPQFLREQTSLVQAELLPLEHRNVIAVLQEFVDGNVPEFTRSEPLIPEENQPTLEEAKKLAIELFPEG